MKFSTNIALTLATAGSIVAAQPHRHHHRHADKRSPAETEVVSVAGPTVVAYELNGQTISQADVCGGIANGTLKWANGPGADIDCSPPAAAAPVSTAVPSTTSTSAAPVSTATSSASGIAAQLYQKRPSASSAQDAATTSASSSTAPASTSAPATSTAVSSVSSYSSSSPTSGGQGLDQEFPDGTLDCSEFPSAYGAIEIPWLNIGGWSGVQNVVISNGEVTEMSTEVSGGGCKEGAMCSYACPPGYQKSQWPATQGSTGQSVGGLSCTGGKLHLTNAALSKNLCIKGVGNVDVKNSLETNAAICRTDYPGTESETVPLNTKSGNTHPLTVPDASTYYRWTGKSTSAQYYINNKGVAEADACSWNVDGSGMGNWAPSYLGIGKDTFGLTWISIASTAQNNPISYTPLDYTVEIVGDNLGGKCRLQNGEYCTGSDYSDCNTLGCTVSFDVTNSSSFIANKDLQVQVMSGTATYVLSE